MMKQHSKLSNLVSLVVGIGIMLPSAVFAQGVANTTTPTNRANFCTSIDQVVAKVSTAMSETEAKLLQKRAWRDEHFPSIQSDKSYVALASHRDKWDTERDAWYQKLDARGTTTEQLAAIAKFKSAVDAAVVARRKAIDDAVDAMHSGIEGAAKERQAAVDTAIATMKADIDAALVKAKADCANSVAPKTVRTTYIASMKAAREKMKTTITALEKRKDTLTPLIAARKAAVAKAITDFKGAIATAHTEFKAVFPVTSRSGTSTPSTPN